MAQDDIGPSGSLGVAEHERDEFTDRDRTRRIVQGAVDELLKAVLYTPASQRLDVERLVSRLKEDIVPSCREYRTRARARTESERKTAAAQRAASRDVCGNG